MTSLFLGLLIGGGALAAFLASGPRAWIPTFILALLLAGAGAGGLWLVDQGPASVFKRNALFSPAQLARFCVFGWLAGSGAVTGVILRRGIVRARGRK